MLCVPPPATSKPAAAAAAATASATPDSSNFRRALHHVSVNRVRYIQRRVLAKNRLLQVLQHWTRLDPKLGDQQRSCLAIDAQRFRLPSGAIEREHLLRA